MSTCKEYFIGDTIQGIPAGTECQLTLEEARRCYVVQLFKSFPLVRRNLLDNAHLDPAIMETTVDSITLPEVARRYRSELIATTFPPSIAVNATPVGEINFALKLEDATRLETMVELSTLGGIRFDEPSIRKLGKRGVSLSVGEANRGVAIRDHIERRTTRLLHNEHQTLAQTLRVA